jgi:hypothetical protein
MLNKLGELYTDNVHSGTVNVAGQLGFLGLACSVINCTPGYGAVSLGILCCANELAGRSADDVKVQVMTSVDAVGDTCKGWVNQARAAIPTTPGQNAPPAYVPQAKKMD